MLIHGPNMPICLSGGEHVVIPDMIGRQFILFTYTLLFLQVVPCSFTVATRLLLNVVVRYIHMTFCKWCRHITHASVFNPYPYEHNLIKKDGGLKPFRRQIHQYPISHIGDKCILPKIKPFFYF